MAFRAAGSSAPAGCYAVRPLAFSAKEAPSHQSILQKASQKAFRGGVAGAAAMMFNVSTMMWVRTTVNFQYRYGYGTFEAMRNIYAEGGGGLAGILRFYKGFLPDMAQVSRPKPPPNTPPPVPPRPAPPRHAPADG